LIHSPIEINRTNPDVLLVLEVRSEADKPHWHFAPTRMTSGEVTLTYGDSRVWETNWVEAIKRPLPTWTYSVTPQSGAEQSKWQR
jgi:hypothetical protein